MKAEIGRGAWCETVFRPSVCRNTWISPILIIVIIDSMSFMWHTNIIAISNMRRGCHAVHVRMVSMNRLLLLRMIAIILKMQRIMVVIMQMMIRLCFGGIVNSLWQICCWRWCCCWSGRRRNTWHIWIITVIMMNICRILIIWMWTRQKLWIHMMWPLWKQWTRRWFCFFSFLVLVKTIFMFYMQQYRAEAILHLILAITVGERVTFRLINYYFFHVKKTFCYSRAILFC